MSLSAADAADRVEQLIVLTRRLGDRLDAETRLFEARRPQEVAQTAGETMELANLYRREAARVRAQPSLIAEAPHARRQMLMQVTTAFESVLARHGRSVEAARIVTEGVVRAIAAQVAVKRTPSAAYSAAGRAKATDASAITLNRRA